MKKATFGAGCFWGVQALFDKIEGVLETEVGYAGGNFLNPTYDDVCSDQTGHAEVVHILFDESKVSFETLLKVFWENHDPTTLNSQGVDIGTQYRSVVFYHDEEQKQLADQMKNELEASGRFKRTIVTAIEPFSSFYKAEEYHQHYLKKKGIHSCSI